MNTKRTPAIWVLVVAVLIAASIPAKAERNEQRGGEGKHVGDRGGRHGDIRHVEKNDHHTWRAGRWHHGRHDGRLGWWWIVAGMWYLYPHPVYPYPTYIPPVVTSAPPPQPVTLALPAATNDIYYDTARVLSATPQSERINTPRQECRTEYIRDSYYNSGERDEAGAIIGSIAGGLLGSQIGRGNGQIVGAAIGAATGAIVGDRIDNSGRRDSSYSIRPVEHCTLIDNWQTVIRNYLVTYRYNGHDYTTTLGYDPGDNMRVRVAVEPDIGSRN